MTQNEIHDALCEGRITEREAISLIYENAYERASELDSPNSPDFQRLLEKIYDDMVVDMAPDLGG